MIPAPITSITATILTFFPHPGGYAGRPGTGQTASVGLAIPEGSLDAWIDLFAREAVGFDVPPTRFGERELTLLDPDGLPLRLVETPGADSLPAWTQGPLGPDHAIRGVHSVTLAEANPEKTASFLTDQLGFERLGRDEERIRFRVGPGPFHLVDIVAEANRGRVAVGSVHHVAFRAENDAVHLAWYQYVATLGLNVSPVMNRDYFRSIYFREPGGVLFELATDEPGFAIDEAPETLGEALMLPEWLEEQRSSIEAALPTIRIPKAPSVSA